MRSALLVLVLAPSARAEPLPIIGGTATKVGDFPTVVAIQVGQGLCTGTLIAPDWVMTAAHCLSPAIVGAPDQATLTKSVRVHFNTVNVNLALGTERSASETFGDPGFDLNDLGHNDLGLVHLGASFDDAEPTPVNFDHDAAPVGVTVTMVGFGTTSGGNMGMAGTELVLSAEVSELCANISGIPGLAPLSDGNVLCFSQADGRGKCEGDSGGPSFATLAGVVTLVGATSFGDQNCAEFGVDTRTDAEHDFIVGHIPELEGGGCCDAGHGGGPTTGLCAGLALLGLRTRRRGADKSG